MIDINLIPASSRKKNMSGALSSFTLGLPQEMVIGVVFAAVVLLVLAHVSLLGVWGYKLIILNSHKAKWANLQPEKAKVDALGNEVKEIKKKTDNLAEIVSSKATGWSRKFNIMSDVLSNGVWIRRIVIDSKSMGIDGVVISKNQNEISAISSFADKLKKDPFFMQDVASVEVGTIQRIKRGITDVSNFTIKVKFK